MRHVIPILLLIAIAGCTVTREQLATYDKRVSQAERTLEKATELLDKAKDKADHKAIEEARQVALEAQSALEAAKASRPEEGEPWWVAIAGIVGSAAAGFVGYRRGLHKPQPQAK